MRNLPLAVVVVSLCLSVPAAWAVDEHHPEQTGAPAVGAAPRPPAMDPDKALKQMKENADKLRAQVDKISKTKDPAERQKLMQEHMQTLRTSMATAGGMMGGLGAGPGGGMGMGTMGGGMMMDCPMMGGGSQGEGTMQRMQQMEKRMDMMQKMMEQMQKPAAPPR